MTRDVLRAGAAPLYQQIAGTLRQRIMRGHWPVGALLPPLERLTEEFQVARVTVRQAIRLLAEEGLVEARRGRGTRVVAAGATRHALKVETTLAALVDLYRDDVPELETEVQQTITDLPIETAPGETYPGYRRMRRIHSRAGERYCVITIHVAEEIFARHEAAMRTRVLLPILFEDPAITVASARQTLVIDRCDIETAALLRLSIGDPTAEVRRILRDERGRILYLADVTYRGDYVRLDMDLLARGGA
jgi:GntR family transcriptional regulator